MKKIILNKDFFNKIIKYSNKFEFNEFISWLSSVNGFSREINKKNINKNHSNIEIISIEDCLIETEKDWARFLTSDHKIFTDAIIKVLKEQYDIDYWQSLLDIYLCCRELTPKYGYGQILTHAINTEDYQFKNIDKLKKLIDILLQEVREDKSRYFSDILEFLYLTTNNIEEYGNDWIVYSIDLLMDASNNNPTKQFNFVANKLKNQIHRLDFNKVKIGKHFKRYVRGNLSLQRTPESALPYFFEMNTQKYASENNMVFQILFNNMIMGLNLINDYLKNEPSVCSNNFTLEKSLLSLSVIYEDKKIGEKIDFLIDKLLDISSKGEVLDNRDFDKYLLYTSLSDNLSESESRGRGRIKI